jgi:hypothetical protein
VLSLHISLSINIYFPFCRTDSVRILIVCVCVCVVDCSRVRSYIMWKSKRYNAMAVASKSRNDRSGRGMCLW